MLLRRGLLSRDIPNTVTIPLLGSVKASNGAEPSVNTGCTLTDTGLYIPKGEHVEYKLSDLYPKPWNKITMELDLMYTNTAATHGWFEFFDSVNLNDKNTVGVDYNRTPREIFFLFDHKTIGSIQKNTYIHVIVSADFSQGDTFAHGVIEGMASNENSLNLAISKPFALLLGHDKNPKRDAWMGYAKNVKVTFE